MHKMAVGSRCRRCKSYGPFIKPHTHTTEWESSPCTSGYKTCLQILQVGGFKQLETSSIFIPCFFSSCFLFLKVLPSAHLPRKYPPVAQLRHDAVATSVASCCGTAVEIFLCRAWATGQLAMQPTLQEAPLWPLGLSSGRTH